MKTFIDLAQEAQAELEAEKRALEVEKDKLAKKASLLAGRESKIDDQDKEVALKGKELQLREEKVSMREGIVGREDKAAKDLKDAEEAHRQSALNLKKSQELNNDATQKLAELSKRELALSEREKSYREEVKAQIASKMLGI